MPKAKNQQPSAFRRWWKSPSVREARHKISNLQVLIYPVLKLIGFVWTWSVKKFVKVDRRGPLYDYLREGRPFIWTNWHEDAFLTVLEATHFTGNHPTICMGSPGRIGRSVGSLLTHYGLEMVHGSNSLGGIEAINQISEQVNRTGSSVLLSADGSRGPTRVAAWGATYLAKNTGLPIIVGRGWAEHLIILEKTWMNLALPLPWGRAVYLTSEPMFLSKEATKEELRAFRARLEEVLNEHADASVAYFEHGPEAAAGWPQANRQA